MDIKDLESEYTEFIGNQQYGTPIAFSKPGQTREEQDIESYFYQHGQFKAWCVPCGCPPPICFCCWTCFFPLAICSCFADSVAEEDAASSARATRNVRYLLFPTMIVKLSKYTNNEVFEGSTVKFSDYPEVTYEVVENIDDNLNDGVIGCIQNSMIPAISGVNVFWRRRYYEYDDRLVPEIRMIIPINEAKRFASRLEETLKNFHNVEYDHSLDQVESQPSTR